ncbi:MAG: hypothetical protein QOG07_1949 [Pseudonocardiales bacterium]|jgi:hypothetical protein|nr:hypothetical protein [Pseudonocardiales bacterium]MDT4976879.1 hypothetical protein [Pseudonocardiales bacterium]MDT4980070.1 hypothetical protein [Pseudonocardiales bacterium]MDT4984840.1 hypothetical protein [Pseudonocardiales bacterium]
MSGVSLTEGDVAQLARQAVDLVDPDIEIQIEPAKVDDPYRFGPHAWLVYPLLDGRRSFGVYLVSSDSEAEASEKLRDAIAGHLGEADPDAG